MKAVADEQAAMEASKAEAVRIAAERAAKAVKVSRAVAWSDLVQSSRWNSIMMQLAEMSDILAEIAECRK